MRELLEREHNFRKTINTFLVLQAFLKNTTSLHLALPRNLQTWHFLNTICFKGFLAPPSQNNFLHGFEPTLLQDQRPHNGARLITNAITKLNFDCAQTLRKRQIASGRLCADRTDTLIAVNHSMINPVKHWVNQSFELQIKHSVNHPINISARHFVNHSVNHTVDLSINHSARHPLNYWIKH